MQHLFGQHCSTSTFRHDEEMREWQSKRISQILDKQSQHTYSTRPSPPNPLQSSSSSPAKNSIIVRKTNPAMTAGHTATPPREILAVSPGSESQSLRRKAVLEGLMEQRVKRARLVLDHDESSPGTTSQSPNEGLSLSPAEGRQNIQSTRMGIPITGSRGLSPQGDSLVDNRDNEDEENLNAYWDPMDEVYRCGSCGHELWISKGECFACSTREYDSYFEVVDPDLGQKPGIVRGEADMGSNIAADERIELFGDCLDLDSSAYDSQDERDEHNDSYEIDSFIDDESILNSQDEDSHTFSDEETDYKQKFYELQRNYFNLVNKYDETLNEYDEFGRDVLGSDYDSIYDSDDREFNEDSIVMVDVAPPDPLLTEVISSRSEQDSSSQEQARPNSLVNELVPATEEVSQKPEALTEEENARAEAYEIALGGRWHDVSLVSTGGNHSYEETEL